MSSPYDRMKDKVPTCSVKQFSEWRTEKNKGDLVAELHYNTDRLAMLYNDLGPNMFMAALHRVLAQAGYLEAIENGS